MSGTVTVVENVDSLLEKGAYYGAIGFVAEVIHPETKTVYKFDLSARLTAEIMLQFAILNIGDPNNNISNMLNGLRGDAARECVHAALYEGLDLLLASTLNRVLRSKLNFTVQDEIELLIAEACWSVGDVVFYDNKGKYQCTFNEL